MPYRAGSRGKDDTITLICITFEIDEISPEDFLDRVCAQMDVPRAEAKLGFKFCDNKVKDLPQNLSTHDDVKHAFEIHREIVGQQAPH